MPGMSDAIHATRNRLRQFKGRYPVICERSGLQYSWLTKFARGVRGKRPSFESITRLQIALDGLEAEDALLAESPKGRQPPQ